MKLNTKKTKGEKKGFTVSKRVYKIATELLTRYSAAWKELA